jgi:predicted RNA-binding Zn-ribbon protein involved in translation (DUF1610 family)
MRSKAKQCDKYSPTRDEIESLLNSEMLCPDCGVKMNWRSKDGRSTVASLQHYRDGTLGVVCLSCNARHASMPNDSYRNMAKDHKFCPSCQNIKHESCFSLDAGRSGNLKRKSYCKTCSNKSVNKWKEKNREQYNEYQRAYRAKRNADGNPITR